MFYLCNNSNNVDDSSCFHSKSCALRFFSFVDSVVDFMLTSPLTTSLQGIEIEKYPTLTTSLQGIEK